VELAGDALRRSHEQSRLTATAARTRPHLRPWPDAYDPYVEAQQVPAAKLDRKRIDEFGLDRCVMCVYCHFDARNDVWNILESLGVRDKAWMFERETLENWLPGGVNLERWIEARQLDEKAAQAVRADAEAFFRRSFGDPDAIFFGIEQ
jgi:hypothetical protein